ncbi:MAG TPA: PH domain-containing protein [Lacipirellulaceae bacterium]|jgi:membrane protein YdbS with pleckstrin-like domain|nr:PH domain-containing protein [Lacipirellulaceae bacterium]
MTCESCGAKVTEDSAFCPRCGAPLEEGAAPSPQGAIDEERAPGTKRMRAAGARAAGNPPSEEDLWTGTYSPKAMVGPAVALGILTVVALVVAGIAFPPALIFVGLGAVVLWAIFGLVLLYRRMTVRYRLTTFRFFHETGLLSRTRNRVEVIDINDVTLSQGLIERMFDVGTIHIQSSDVTHPDLHLVGIENVREITDLIDNTRRAERQRRGLFMENIGGMG